MFLKALMPYSSAPMLKETLKNRLKIVEEHLQDLLDPETDPQLRLLALCREFIDEIKTYTAGGPFVPRTEFQSLAKELWDAHPKFDVSRETNDNPPGGDANAHADKGVVPEFESGILSHNASDEPDRILSLQDIRTLVDVKRGLELEPFIPWEVYHFAMKASLHRWKNICFQSFDNIESHLNTLVETCASRIFHNFQNSGLLSSVKYCSVRSTKLNLGLKL
jgi:hypothetical protein